MSGRPKRRRIPGTNRRAGDALDALRKGGSIPRPEALDLLERIVGKKKATDVIHSYDEGEKRRHRLRDYLLRTTDLPLERRLQLEGYGFSERAAVAFTMYLRASNELSEVLVKGFRVEGRKVVVNYARKGPFKKWMLDILLRDGWTALEDSPVEMRMVGMFGERDILSFLTIGMLSFVDEIFSNTSWEIGGREMKKLDMSVEGRAEFQVMASLAMGLPPETYDLDVLHRLSKFIAKEFDIIRDGHVVSGLLRHGTEVERVVATSLTEILADTSTLARDWVQKNADLNMLFWMFVLGTPREGETWHDAVLNADDAMQYREKEGILEEQAHMTEKGEEEVKFSPPLASAHHVTQSLEHTMSFYVDPDARELILNQGVPTRIYPEFITLTYPSMFIDTRLMLANGSMIEGIYIERFDGRPVAKALMEGKHCFKHIGSQKSKQMHPSEANTMEYPLHSSAGEDGGCVAWSISYVSTDGDTRSAGFMTLGIEDVDGDLIPLPHRRGKTKHSREILDFIIGLLLFVNLPEVEWVTDPKKLKAKMIRKREVAREKKGLLPTPERNVIQLTGAVKRYIGRISEKGAGGRRHHQVRGHIRIFRAKRYKEMRGKTIWVDSHERGFGTTVKQEYEVRGG